MSLPHSFKAMVVRETPENQFVREVKQQTLERIYPSMKCSLKFKYSVVEL